MISRRTRWLAAALLLVAPAGLCAQQAQPDDEVRVSLDFQDVEITSVIKTIAKITGRSFLYDDRVRGRVTVISETPVSVDEAYRVFESILQVKGFTTVEGPGGITKIIPLGEAKKSPISTQTGARVPANRDQFITRLVPLRYVKAESIVNTLQPLVSKDANLIAYAPTNTMILTDTASNIRRLLTLLAQIDADPYQEQIRVFPIQYADAARLASHLEEIFSEKEGALPASAASAPTQRTRLARRARGERAGRAPAEAAAEAQAAAAVFGAAGQARFITDERTNSIIVLALQATIREVERLIALLDYQRKGTGRIHVYRLQNADAEEMAETLSLLAGGGARRAPGAPGAAAQQAAEVAELEGGVRITADAPTNSLIIQASGEGFAAIRDVVEELDLRRPQVMVEALIMEVDAGDISNLGAGFLYRSLMGAEDGRQLAIGSANPALVPDPNSPDLISALATGQGNFASAILGRTITLADGTEVPVIQGIITASATDTDTNIISAPVILTADNEEAQIVVGENIPIITSRLQDADITSQISQNIERQDVGVTLRVTPQISEGDAVRLDIFQEISQVISENPDLGPTTSNRTVENTVYVRDGEAVMIGGILQETQLETVNKVPFLGDIPILGWAFKATSDSVRKTNLLVILTPHIVRDPEDLQKLTLEQREKFRSAAGETMEWTEEDLEARRKALEAGIPLPLDPNPVRRELEVLTEEHPTEQLPELRERQSEREEERRRALEEAARALGGNYRVQVSLFRTPEAATALLEALIQRGYDGSVLSRREGGEIVHVVQLGPYLSEEQAQRVAREVSAETGLGTSVLVER